jgi:putative nucleotidyltransferase with HDIG domain
MGISPRITPLGTLRDSIQELPTIPETLNRILDLLEDPDSGARDLAEVMRSDPPLAAKILRLANSPLYRKQRTLTTIQEGVAVLGYRTVRQVALCVSVISTLAGECAERGSPLDYRQLWRHGVTVGTLAGQLARLRGGLDPETVFTAGLLHDLGKFVLVLEFPGTYGSLLAERRREGRRLAEMERRELGFDHARAGEELANAWNFPVELAEPIGAHHDLQPPSVPAAVVALADDLGNRLDPPACDLGFDPDAVDPGPLYDAAGLTPAAVEAHREALDAALADAAPLRDLA